MGQGGDVLGFQHRQIRRRPEGGQGIYRFLQQGKAVLCPRLPYPRPIQGEVLEAKASGHCAEQIRGVAKRRSACVHFFLTSAEHYAYLPDTAEEMARDRLTTSREGANLTYEEYEIQDAILRDRIIDKGQSIHHVLATNGKELGCSEKTLYRRIEKGVYTVKAHHLPRQVSLKKRKYKKKYEYEHDPKTDRTGHLYSDWLIYRYKNGITYYFQMDFLGAPRKSDKEILVLTMTGISFSLLYIIENATQEKIIALFDTIEGEIGIGNFRKLFPAILTDRDTLFDDFPSLEFDKNGEPRTRIFFCDPGESNQKPNVENYNAQLRPIFPKRAVLNEYSQQELYLASSNLNSRCLSSIDDRTPTDLFVEIFGKGLLDLLHQRKIPPKEVRIKPIHR